MPHILRSDFQYTPLFCEENIWKLIESLYINPLAKPIDVIFILNSNETIALFGQQKSKSSQPVIWDYHVILTAYFEDEIVVFDFDSRCDFPIRLSEYFALSFPEKITLHPTYQPLLKAISANKYFKYFYSDRQHMTGIINKNEFPQYEIITPINRTEQLSLKQCRSTDTTICNTKLVSPEAYLKQALP